MAMNYVHSETFARLKGIQEQISVNLTSFQYLNTLDTLIYNALYPVIDNTKYVDIFLAKILGWQSTNPKRKASGVGRHALISYITVFFIADKTEKKIELLQQMKLDRGILMEILRRWLKVTEEYEELANSPKMTKALREKLDELEVKASLRLSHNLYGASTQARYWFEMAQQFKGMILEKYTRMCLNRAQMDYVDLKGRAELGDIVQVYMLTASKAIDKCDTNKGVLTSHIQNWLMSAKNTVTANYLNGVAFQTPNHSKDANGQFTDNNTCNIEDIDDMAAPETSNVDREDRIDRVRLIGKIFDPVGYGRLMLGISEVLSVEDRQVLRTFAIKEDKQEHQSAL